MTLSGKYTPHRLAAGLRYLYTKLCTSAAWEFDSASGGWHATMARAKQFSDCLDEDLGRSSCYSTHLLPNSFILSLITYPTMTQSKNTGAYSCRHGGSSESLKPMLKAAKLTPLL